MNDTLTETTTEVIERADNAVKPKSKNRFESAQPVLEKLFQHYPQLFGERFLPLKLGIFQELMAAHPSDFKRDELKTALGVHTRSSRYLQCVASGLQRHDLQGQPVEDVAPEHVFMAIAELFTRRQAKSKEDLRPKLRAQLVHAFDQSGLLRADYLARIGSPSEDICAVLDEAISQVEQQRARQAALTRAFEGSGQTLEVFAASLGMEVSQVRAALKKP
ncbi:MAG: activator of osmoprotectant transporter [Comamonadaceae bacterium]|nr:MAG: activator of osmoprotectant transporter [Comamonadaceae bacterium]